MKLTGFRYLAAMCMALVMLIFLVACDADDSQGDVTTDGSGTTDVTTAAEDIPDTPDVHTHTAGEWVVDKEATCAAAGSRHKACTACGETVATEVIAATGHTEGEWVVDTAAGCTTAGKKHLSCTVCGLALKQSSIPALGHGETETVTTDPTCTLDGKIEETCKICGVVLSTVNVPHGAHTESDWIVDLGPTAETDGRKHKECLSCGEILSEERIPSTGATCTSHVGGNWVTTKSATCTAEGSETQYCINCGEVAATRTVPAKGHSETVLSGKAATCTEAGLTDGKECSVCGDITEAQREIPASGHTEETVPGKAATCTKTGLTDGKKCAACGKTLVAQETIAATGHTLGAWVTTTQPTCTAAGTRTQSCTVCRAVINTESVSATGHTESGWITDKAPTQTETGSKHIECTVCGTVLSTATIPVLPSQHTHVAGAWQTVTSPTCTAAGLKAQYCTDCGEQMATDTVAALGHTEGSWSVETAATCTEAGLKTKRCTVCAEKLAEETVAATGHTLGAWVTTAQPTCTAAGTKTQSCTVCRTVINTESVSATGHTESGWITDKAPTQTETGSKHTECTVCGVTINTATIPVTTPEHTHSAGAWQIVTNPTCTTAGSKAQYCTGCGEQMATDTVAALGHTEGEWVITVDPTCTYTGMKYLPCARCDHIFETAEIPMTDHVSGEWTVTSNATCSTTGTKVQYCTGCGKEMATATVPTTGHTAGAWTTQTAAGCETTGTKIQTCTGCGTTMATDTIPATGHTAGAWKTQTAASCQTTGTKIQSCTVCGATMATDTIPATGHTESAWITETAATTTSTGLKYKKCTVCHTRLSEEVIPMLTTNVSSAVDTTLEHVVDPSQWVVIDGLDRAEINSQAGGTGVDENKVVAMFYWSWHGTYASNAYAYNNQKNLETMLSKGYNAAQYWTMSASALRSIGVYTCDGGNGTSNSTLHFWNEPIWGYYDGEDEWVIRKQAELLAAAGVDVIFLDNSNGAITWMSTAKKIMKVFSEARKQGVDAPAVSFVTTLYESAAPGATGLQINDLYNNIYSIGYCKDVWFYMPGDTKPLLMSNPDWIKQSHSTVGAAVTAEVENFFTYRKCEPQYKSYYYGQGAANTWGWARATGYQYAFNGGEQMTVTTALNYSASKNYLAPLSYYDIDNATYQITTRSWTGTGYDSRGPKYGAQFATQWENALAKNPKVVFVNGWNEWVAMKMSSWSDSGHTFNHVFVDQYSDEASRDIEPTTGSLKDYYYYQLTYYIRKFKGMNPIEKGSGVQSGIKYTGKYSAWADIGPTYTDYFGLSDRAASGYINPETGTRYYYTNTTARNDFYDAKVAHDDTYIYFMVRCVDSIDGAYATAQDWMRLYISTNTSTSSANWEGYEYVVGKVNPTSTTKVALHQFTGNGYNTTEKSTVNYYIASNDVKNVMVVRIPKADLGISGNDFVIDFKWMDNCNEDEDFMNVYSNGDAAPLGRYNYRYDSQ